MGSLFYWTGLFVWAALAAGAFAIFVLLTRDCIDAVRFGLRLWKTLPPDQRTAKIARAMGWYCLKIAFGFVGRPDKMTSTETGRVAYWPRST